MKRRISAVLVTAGLTVAGVFGVQGTANAAGTESTDPPYIPITCVQTGAWSHHCWWIEGTQLCESNWDGYSYSEWCNGPDLWPDVPASNDTVPV